MLTWLEPSIENHVNSTFEEMISRTNHEAKVREIIIKIKNSTDDEYEKDIDRIQNIIYDWLYTASNDSYRAGFNAAIKLR